MGPDCFGGGDFGPVSGAEQKDLVLKSEEQEFRDNWTLGFPRSLTTVVWVGNPDNTPVSHSSSGIVGAAPIWHQFMEAALQEVPDEWYPAPSGLEQIGDNVFLPSTENLPPVLARPWPFCPFQSYVPTTITWNDILVGGVPCTLW